MKITTLQFQNFRGFRELDFTPAPCVTFIVAMNGVGKTSVIESLAIALGGFKRGVLLDDRATKPSLEDLVGEADHRREWLPEQEVFITEPRLTIDASAEWGGHKVSWQLHSISPETEKPRKANPWLKWLEGRKEVAEELRSAARDTDQILPLLLALRAKRLARGDKMPIASFGERSRSSFERLSEWGVGPYFDQDWYTLRTIWLTLEQEGEIHGKRAKAVCESIASALKRALQLEKPPVFSPDEEDFLVALPGEGVRAVGLMSDGWRSYVTLVAGLAMHCAQINPMRLDAAQETPGVLLVDEIEQHLHPRLQLDILNGLRDAFPKLQIIATTHSPLVLTDVGDNPENAIFRLDRDENDAIELLPLKPPVGKNVLQVLTGDWFGLSSTYDDETLHLLERHRELLRQGAGKREEARTLADQIRARIGRYAETSVEEMVLSVVAELERDRRFGELTHEQIRELRVEVLRRINEGLP